MAVEIKLLTDDITDVDTIEVEATDLETGEIVETKKWFEKSKNKWHFVFAKNSANRKYLALNEFQTKAVDGIYVVEDRTTPPRVLGSSTPDARLVPFMTDEDKVLYDEIIARAKAEKERPLTEKEKIEKQIASLNARLTGVPVKRADFILPDDQETYTAIIERAAEAKANAPKPERKPRAPLTPEQKIKRDENKLAALQAKLAELKAAQE